MRAFFNQWAINKISDSDITTADYKADELLGKIDMVDKTSKNLIEDEKLAHKGSFLPHLFHNTVPIN